jgi:protein-tyrosine phosphatase
MTDFHARHLNLEGASNFRDLGGYPTGDGHTLRWRQLFRSNHLGHLTDADVTVVRGLGVTSAFDFRGVDERAAAACVIPEIIVHSLPIEPTVVAALRAKLQARALMSQDALEIMRESYRGYVRTNTHSFREMFTQLVNANAPSVIHCTAGKDRTGFAVALILNALAVPTQVISDDYLLTNRYYRRDPNSAPDLPADVRQAIGSVDSSFLAAGFDAVNSQYGDLESYFRDGLGLGVQERTELKQRYLQAA